MSSFNALRCDFCDGNLVIDDSREFAICEFCGTKYMASTLRAKIQEIRGTVKVDGAVETTTGDVEKERLIKNAETLLKLEKFDDAEKTIKTITTQFSDDYRGWFLLYQLSLFRIRAGLDKSYYDGKYYYTKMYYGSIPKTDDASLISALKLCKNTDLINQFFLDVISSYGSEIHTINYSDANDYDYDNKEFLEFEIIDTNGTKLNPPTIDAFTIWLLFSSNETSRVIKNQIFERFRNRIAQIYYDKICDGQIVPYIFHDNNDKWILEPLTNKKIQTYSQSMLIFNYLNQFSKLKEPKYGREDFFIKIGGALLDTYNVGDFIIYGKYIFVKDYYNNTLTKSAILKLPRMINNNDIYTANNLCMHCGGKFKGVFSKVCSQCGKPKNY